MFQVTPRLHFMKLFYDNRPRAYADMKGNDKFPDLRGTVYFYEVPNGGILIEAEIFGLPQEGGVRTPSFYGFHIHENGGCSDNFLRTGAHYNPDNLPHPYHAGDLIPLFSADGYAWTAFYDTRLELHEIIGKAIVIHRNPDDFMTQPSGNSGEMIGCGMILSADGKTE